MENIYYTCLLCFGALLCISSSQFINNKPWPRYSLENMPRTSFTCRDKILGGYYADSETQCQMFHVCVKVAGVGVQDFRFLCPNGTAFDQEAQTCVDWGDVDCEQATLYYGSDNFDLYRIGSGFESKRAPFAEEEEATFHLQRAETSDARRSKLTVVNQSVDFFKTSQPYQPQKTAVSTTTVGPTLKKIYEQNSPVLQKIEDYSKDSEELFKGSHSSNFFQGKAARDELIDFNEHHTPTTKAQKTHITRQRGRSNFRTNGNSITSDTKLYTSSSTPAPFVVNRFTSSTPSTISTPAYQPIYSTTAAPQYNQNNATSFNRQVTASFVAGNLFSAEQPIYFKPLNTSEKTSLNPVKIANNDFSKQSSQAIVYKNEHFSSSPNSNIVFQPTTLPSTILNQQNQYRYQEQSQQRNRQQEQPRQQLPSQQPLIHQQSIQQPQQQNQQSYQQKPQHQQLVQQPQIQKQQQQPQQQPQQQSQQQSQQKQQQPQQHQQLQQLQQPQHQQQNQRQSNSQQRQSQRQPTAAAQQKPQDQYPNQFEIRLNNRNNQLPSSTISPIIDSQFYQKQQNADLKKQNYNQFDKKDYQTYNIDQYNQQKSEQSRTASSRSNQKNYFSNNDEQYHFIKLTTEAPKIKSQSGFESTTRKFVEQQTTKTPSIQINPNYNPNNFNSFSVEPNHSTYNGQYQNIQRQSTPSVPDSSPRGFSFTTPSAPSSFAAETNNRLQSIGHVSDNYTVPSVKKFSTLVPRDLYNPTTFKPTTYKKQIEEFKAKYEIDQNKNKYATLLAKTSTTTTTKTTTTVAPTRTTTTFKITVNTEEEEDDGQYRPELYEQDFVKNKLKAKKLNNNNYNKNNNNHNNNLNNKNNNNHNYNNNDNTFNNKYNFNSNYNPDQKNNFSADEDSDDELLNTAHSQNIAASGNELLKELARKASIKSDIIRKEQQTTQQYYSPTIQKSTTTTKTTKKPTPGDKDASYDYAYYDTGISDNSSHDYSEYGIVDFGRTTKKKQ